MQKGPAFTIKKERLKTVTNSITPGPADYSPKAKEHEGITFPRSPRSIDKDNSSASFLNYNIHRNENGPAFSIPRANLQKHEGGYKPGPADYRP